MLPGNSFPKQVVEDLQNVAEDGIEDILTQTEQILLRNGIETDDENISKAKESSKR